MIDAWLDLLRCPDDGATLRATDAHTLTCTRCGRDLPVHDGIARLLPADDAAALDPAETAMHQERAARDDEADEYDQLYDDRSCRHELATYRRQFDAQPGETVLDVGAGTGRVTKEYMASVGRLVAADHSLESLRVLRRRLPAELADRVLAVQCVVGRLPLADDAFDAVVSTSLFSNIPTAETRQEGLDEIARVVKPGGRLLITVYNHCWTRRVRARLGLSQTGAKSGCHSGGRVPFYNYDPREFRDWVATRFEPGPIFGLNHRVPVLSPLSASLASYLDALLYRIPGTLRIAAKEMGMTARRNTR